MLADYAHFGDLPTRNRQLFPNSPGLVCDGERRTWAQLDARINRLAHALSALGLSQGQRLAILSANRLGFVETLFAAARLGLVTVPLNTLLAAHEVTDLLADSGAVALFADRAHLETAREAATGDTEIRWLIDYEGSAKRAPGEVLDYEALVVDQPESTPKVERKIAADDPLIILYTSGTTGLPKGVLYSHGGALLGTLIHVLAIGSHRRHRVMLPSPLYSAAGFAGIACAVAVGSESHVIRFSVDEALDTLHRERITFTNLVPTTVQRVLDHSRLPELDVSHLEVLLYGGSPMPPDLLRRAAGVLNCGFRQTFATSETGLAGTVLEPHEHRLALDEPASAHLLRSCGRPQVGVGVRILDENWQELPRGEAGDIAVCCDANMIGYWNRPEATAEVLQDGWLKTGDIARQDDEGYVYLLDRKNDMIVTGALNVFPSEVEAVLREHPTVADCVVVGLPDPQWGEAVTAFIVPKDGVVPRDGAPQEAESIGAHCRQRLAGYKRPKSIRFTESIPRNAAGKPLRRLLRDNPSKEISP